MNERKFTKGWVVVFRHYKVIWRDFFCLVFMVNRCLIISILILTASFLSFLGHEYVWSTRQKMMNSHLYWELKNP